MSSKGSKGTSTSTCFAQTRPKPSSNDFFQKNVVVYYHIAPFIRIVGWGKVYRGKKRICFHTLPGIDDRLMIQLGVCPVQGAMLDSERRR
jgi:hypothetical protein